MAEQPFFTYLLRALKADPALGGPHAAAAAGQGHSVQAHLQSGLLVLERQAPGPWLAAVVFLLIVPGMAVNERRPAAAAHPQTAHGAGASVRVRAGLSRIGAHKHQNLQFIKKHADPILEHVGLETRLGIILIINVIIIVIITTTGSFHVIFHCRWRE